MSTIVHDPHPVPEATRECTHCRRRAVPANQWRAATTEQRQTWKQRRVVRHEARGLCASCYRRKAHDGNLIDHERLSFTRDEVMEEWERNYDPARTVREQAVVLAPRLGMSVKALEGALRRAGVRSPYVGGYGYARKDGCAA